MKKMLLFAIVAFLFTSCKKEPGSINGVVTYYFNEYQGSKPDLGAKVYITKTNCDSLTEYFRAITDIEIYKITKMNNGDFSYTKFSDYQKEISYFAIDSLDFDRQQSLMYSKLLRIIDRECVNKTTVDGAGNYSVDLPPGDYNVIFVSAGRTCLNLLEVNGQIKIKSVSVKSKEKSNIDIEFNLR